MIPGGKILWKRERLPTPVFWLGEFHGLYRPWGHKELDTTERLSHTHTQVRQGCLAQADGWVASGAVRKQLG